MSPTVARLRLILVLAAYNIAVMAIGGALCWPYLFERSNNAYLPLLGFVGSAGASIFGSGLIWHQLSRGYRSDPFLFLAASFIWGSVGPFFAAHGIEAAASPVVEVRTTAALHDLVDRGHRTFAMPGCVPNTDATRLGRAEVSRTLYEPDHALGPRTERAIIAPLRCPGEPTAAPAEVWTGAERASDLTLWHTDGAPPHYRVAARTTRLNAYAHALAQHPAPSDPIVLEPAMSPDLSGGMLRGLAVGWALSIFGLGLWCTRPWEPSDGTPTA